ncbi:MAG: signal peptidase II [Planctomycetota bacterium]
MAKPADQSEPKASTAETGVITVGRKPVVLVYFLLLTGVLLAGDLWLKAWSFEHIADHPIRLESSADGPVVFLYLAHPLTGDQGWHRADDVYINLKPGVVPPHDSTRLVPKALDLQLTLNTGAVFGLGKGARPVFIAVSLVATGVIFFLLWRSPARGYLYHIALAMILAGALGNLYDRVRFAAVRDMLHMLPQTRLWPWIFNFADVTLVVGVCLVLLLSFLSERRQRIAESASG